MCSRELEVVAKCFNEHFFQVTSGSMAFGLPPKIFTIKLGATRRVHTPGVHPPDFAAQEKLREVGQPRVLRRLVNDRTENVPLSKAKAGAVEPRIANNPCAPAARRFASPPSAGRQYVAATHAHSCWPAAVAEVGLSAALRCTTNCP
jgi:hypothetical protein